MATTLVASLCLMFAAAIGYEVLAADGDTVTDSRNSGGFLGGTDTYRVKLCDADTSTGACTASAGPEGLVPYSYYRVWVEESDACTSWTLMFRDYPITTGCQGSCDSFDLQQLIKGTLASKTFHEPLGEQFDADITEITACTIDVYVDFYRER